MISAQEYLLSFLISRRAMGVSPGTMQFYQVKLGRFFSEVDVYIAKRHEIEQFLIKFNSPGNRHAYYRAIRTFYRWREEEYELPNPMKHMKAPRLPKLMLPSLTREQVLTLIDQTSSVRDKAIISVFVESGLRLSELTNIKAGHIDWDNKTIQVVGKGRKEALAPLGSLSRNYLKQWISTNQAGNNIWGINMWGIESMLRRLGKATRIQCNPHTLRRTFACLLRKAGLDTMTIKDLGRWESLEMVQRYTRTVTFHDSLRLYQEVLT